MFFYFFFFVNFTVLYFFFFFQAEDGIRDLIVTGVHTCALPIFAGGPARRGAAVRRCRAAARLRPGRRRDHRTPLAAAARRGRPPGGAPRAGPPLCRPR